MHYYSCDQKKVLSQSLCNWKCVLGADASCADVFYESARARSIQIHTRVTIACSGSYKKHLRRLLKFFADFQRLEINICKEKYFSQKVEKPEKRDISVIHDQDYISHTEPWCP